ncbi:MAG: hypothetical protein M1825_005011 [Sarcosagium campestre]|nr:MAG: hypothetical protein M1825_005011 [Sarcosagium campestre]
MQAHFADYNAENLRDKWDQLWKNRNTPFDRGTPNPALRDLLQEWTESRNNSEAEPHRRKRALVPGCGRGYDVLLLASYGYDAVGLEISESAIESCKQYAADHTEDYPVASETLGRGQATFILGDFFQDHWLQEIDGPKSFDLCYDYTFLCALLPALRPSWALRYSQLISKANDGVLVCVEFPTNKPPSAGGPPFGLPPSILLGHLSRPGEDLVYNKDGYLEEGQQSEQENPVFRRILHYMPKRTHEVGQGNDWVSVWQPTR